MHPKTSSEKIQMAPKLLVLHSNKDATVPNVAIPLRSRRGSSSSIDTESLVFQRNHFSCIKAFVLVFMWLLVMMMCILGSYHLYTPSKARSRVMCTIPYSNYENSSLVRFRQLTDDFGLNWQSWFPWIEEDLTEDLHDEDFFHEEIETDLADESGYAKIEVPDFANGRSGRFMHDFRRNQSAIIDPTAMRCFVMPLDFNTTMPPKNWVDLQQKLSSGYYINTDRIRRKMLVKIPPIDDRSQISEYIAAECSDKRIYMLEECESGVVKRAVHEIPDEGKFAQFAGKSIVEFDLVNIPAIADFEKVFLI